MRKFLRTALGVIAAIAFTAILVEAMYRYYLSRIVAEDVARAFQPSQRPTFGAYGVPPWRFSPDLGFTFNEQPWRAAIFKDGTFEKCENAGQGNRFGNYGKAPDDYASADLKIMVVGSSYTMVYNADGKLIDEVLGDRLSARLNKRVRILNFSRDATGVLSNLDIVRYKLDEIKPDIVLALMNVTALVYQRHWRTVKREQDDFHRMYFLLDADESASDPKRAVAQPQVISDRITDEWCKKIGSQTGNPDALRKDPLARDLVSRHQTLQRDMAIPRVLIDFWRLDLSFVMNLLRTGEPFSGMNMFSDQPIYSKLELQRFTDDAAFNTAVDRIKKSGVPLLPIHLPTLNEMKAHPHGGFEFLAHGVPTRQGASLVASLEQAIGERFDHLYRRYSAPHKADPAQLVNSATGSHPSKLGVDAMADALERLLLEHPRTAPLLTRNSKAAAQ